MIDNRLIEHLIKGGFKEHPDKPGLYCGDCGKIVETDSTNTIAYVDFRKTPRGRRYYTRNGEMHDDADKIGILENFKDVRDQLLGKEEEKNVSVIPQQQTKVAKNAPESKNVFKTGKLYNVSGKSTPDAALTQQNANIANISISIIEATQDENCAHAEIRATSPSGNFIEDCVHHDFNLMKEVVMMDLIKEAQRANKKIVIESDANGRPVLSGEMQQRLYERWIRMKYFSLRDAITKATRRAQMKLLNSEWREKEEIEAETMEENMVK